ncbi:MAG TPA: Gfo/Idh/MocA family oxidoreductase [Armatimonadetes bacterium]|nr:Gfo/Idh/MocA family oxidoreductase [Armatimonadota bacterium]
MQRRKDLNRREFLHQAATAAGATLLTAGVGPKLWAQVAGANERVNIGVIGCGGMGNSHISTLLKLREEGLVNIVAVCDVYTKRLDRAAARTGAKPYRDYRRLLEDPEVDAVLIATPDHWHAPMTIAAADAGKDVYCEKPMTYWKDLREPQEVVRAIARNQRVMQVGTQGMSDSIWEQVAERIQAGALGTLIHAQASDCRNGYIALYDPTRTDPDLKPGETLDWDLWLGPAPKRPFEPGRYLSFRVFWDYSGGVGTDFFPHLLTPLVQAMGLTFPKRVTASGGLYYYHDGREVPDIFSLVIEYPQGPSVLLLGGVANDTGLPIQIRGQQATLTIGGPGAVVDPQRAVNKEGQREEIARTRRASLAEHWKDFLQSVKTREKPRSHEVLGYYVMTALHMGITSYLTGRTLEFDPQTEQTRPV